MLEWTGERYVPWVDDATISYEHLHRYGLAKAFVRDKNVLDLACGEGYGSFMLSEEAHSVTGVDIDAASIRHASSKYVRENLRFIEGSIADVPIKGEKIFDVIVCFEALEHIEDHDGLMKEVKRLLKENGIFIVSAPNRYTYSDQPNYQNPFHLKELYFDEFKGLLSKHFENTLMYGQKVYPSSNIFPLHKESGPSKNLVIGKGDQEFIFLPPEKKLARYFIAVASNSKLEKAELIGSSHLIDISETLFRQKDVQISHLEGVVREREGEAERLRAGLAEKDGEIGNLKETMNRKATQISHLEGVVRERDGEIGNLNETVTQRDARVAHLEGVVREREAEAERLRVGLAEKERGLADLREAITGKDSKVSELIGVLSERDVWIANREAAVREKEGALNHIYNSHGWKALLVYYRARDKILPINTKRRLFVKVIFKMVTNPRGILRNLNNKNLKKFGYYFRTVEPAIIEQKIEKKISDVSVVGKCSAVSEPPPIKMEFERNISEESIEDLNFPYYNQPLVSIIIPVRNNWRYTYACLKSILLNTKEVPFEVIAVNDQSTDETPEMLERISGIQIINNAINLGWLKNCNNAADHAKGKYILLLNNDTEVTEGWLANLVQIAEDDEKIGVVGGKILYPDGRLQEAGSVMDAEGWGQPYGRFDDPDRYEHNYVKETDFITGVCLLIRQDIFLKLGGFDEIYAPAFYEEFDLEFAIREAGYKVIYQPRAVIVHHQTSSYGSEIRDSRSSINHAKFIKKWASQISGQIEDSDIFFARDRSENKKVILLIDERIPDYDKNAGSLTTYQYIRLFQEIGFKVILIPDSLVPLEPYTTELQQMGIEVVYGQFEFKKWIKQNGGFIHYVWLARPDIAVKYIEAIKKYSGAKILYYTHDLHYLRELRRYEVERKKEILEESNRLKQIEFYLFGNVDSILTPSDYENVVIKENFVNKEVVTIPAYYYDVNSLEEISPGFESREGLIFLGGFGHEPNVDGVKWFISKIYPSIKREVPEIKFYIVGSNPPPEIIALSRSDIIVTGYVKDLGPLFQKCRVFVCPLRYGAGVKGKTVMSMYYAVPAVSTSVGNEGLNLKHCAEAFIADDPIKFANWTVELYTNPKIWTRLSENSLRFVKNNFSKEKAKYVILETLRNK